MLRLSDVLVTVSEAKENLAYESSFCREHAGALLARKTEIICEQVRFGRYVQLQMIDTGSERVLSFAELQVVGY